MALPYDPRTQFPTDGGKYAISRWMGEFRVEPIVKEIDPWHRPGDLTFEQPGAKLINHTSVPMHRPGAQGWGGKFEFDTPTGLYMQCNRAMWQKGTKANLFHIANFDVGAFDKSPGTVAIELGNIAPLSFVAMLNGCFSMAPKDKNGNPIDNGSLVICRDQIYGGAVAVMSSTDLVAWVTGTAYTVGQLVTANGNVYRAGSTATSGATAPSGTTTSSDGTITWTYVYAATNQALKVVNPANPDFMSGSSWYNCHQQFSITADHIVEAIINQQTRPAMNGVELGLGDEGVEIWVPFASKERARQLIEVFRQIPGTGATGVTPTQVPITGGTTSQVIFSVQDNPVFGRAKVRAITGMRSDLWCVVSPRPKPLPQYSLFIHALGGSVGEYAIQDDPQAMGGDTVPHIAVFQFPAGAQSPMFTGAMWGTVAGDIGIAMILNEGYAFGSGMLIDFCFTGYPS
jgi:hypothetical protein